MAIPNLNGMQDEARGVALAIMDRLDLIVHVLEEQDIEEHFRYIPAVLNSGATDEAQTTLTPPPGHHWRVRRYAIVGSVNGGFALYLNEAQPQNLLEGNFDNSAMAADATDIWIPAGNALVVRFFLQPANQVCTVNLQVTEITL